LIQEITGRHWQAEARAEETKQLIRDIKRITRRKFSAEEKALICIPTSCPMNNYEFRVRR